MRALVLERPGTIPSLKEVPIPDPGPDDVLVQVEACGMGLTVRDKLRRINPARLPRVPGHEFAGTVVALGSGVNTWKVGDRVAAFYYLFCGRCRRCSVGQQNLCLNEPRRIGEHADGGFADYVAVSRMSLVPVPGDLGSTEATVACDAVGTSVHVCRRARIGEGSRVLVIGAAGGVGIHLVQVASAQRAEVCGVDIGARKMEALTRLHVRALDASDPEWDIPLRGKVDVAVDLIGTVDSFERAYRLLDDGGQVVRMVTYKDISHATISPGLGVGERSVLGSRYCTLAELNEAMQLLVDGRVQPIIGAIEPLERFGAIVEMLDDRSLIGRAAVTTYSPVRGRAYSRDTGSAPAPT